jgi:hypothetical protein
MKPLAMPSREMLKTKTAIKISTIVKPLLRRGLGAIMDEEKSLWIMVLIIFEPRYYNIIMDSLDKLRPSHHDYATGL